MYSKIAVQLRKAVSLRLLRRRPPPVHLLYGQYPEMPEAHQRPVDGRIDIHLDVQRMPYQKLTAIEGGEKSAVIRARIEAARERWAAHM